MTAQDPTQIITDLIKTLIPNQEHYYINTDNQWIQNSNKVSLIALAPDPTGKPTAYHHNTIFTILTKTNQVYQHDTYHPLTKNNYTEYPVLTLEDPDSIHKLQQLIQNHQPKTLHQINNTQLTPLDQPPTEQTTIEPTLNWKQT